MRVDLGAKIDWIFWVALAGLLIGSLLLVSGAATIYFALRRPSVAASPVILPSG